MPSMKEYMKTLAGRKKETRAFTQHQATGAELAVMLDDVKHTALYIKLAMQFNETRLRGIAKNIAENKEIRNKGAYFMSVLYSEPGKPAAGGNKGTTKRDRP
jgi:hypothetical protein